MEIEEAMLVEVAVDGGRHIMTDTHHTAESIGAQTQMGVLTHILERLAFLLHGIVRRTRAKKLYLAALELHRLSRGRTLDEQSSGGDAGASGDLAEQLLVELCGVNDDLDIVDGRAIVKCYEIDCL